MATLTRGLTFGASETVTNTKLHNLVDLGGVSNIVDADCSPSMGLSDTKLADITTGNKVRGSALGNLASIPDSAGLIPFANIGNLGLSLASIPASSLVNLASIPQNAGQFNYKAVVASLASGGSIIFDGTSQFVGKAVSDARTEIFTSSGTFVAPAGITSVLISGCGAGAGGGGSDAGTNGGGGGGGGSTVFSYPYTIVPGNSYTVTINNAGTGGGASSAGNNGGTSVFDSLTINGGTGGAGAPTGTGGAGGTNYLVGTAGSNKATSTGGNGGGSPFGTGGTGSAGNVGGTGTGYGVGGGGGGAGGGGNYAGGNGTKGIIIVSW